MSTGNDTADLGDPTRSDGAQAALRHRVADDAPTDAEVAGSRLRWWKELLFIGGFYLVYSFVRNLFGSAPSGDDIDATAAFQHARQVIDIEKALGLYFEAHLQRWYLDLPALGLIRFWNIFYGTAHFVVTAGALFWLYRTDKPRYPRWRNTLALTTAVALVGFASYSLMPPRLLDAPGPYGACRIHSPEAAAQAPAGADRFEGCDRYGYVDTIVVHGGWISYDDDKAAGLTNQYAAMPSMHIGWATWSALVLAPMARRRWAKALVWSYPVLTLFAIMVTANHYWIDAVGGLAALAVGAALARRLTTWLQARANPELALDAATASAAP
ncbi:MAG TPA: phosphatase PAP2 family protein [Acidimicrobiales bacterium]|nr:phosphatase PAP2 family protein [Acidimicrobiales bacterium]